MFGRLGFPPSQSGRSWGADQLPLPVRRILRRGTVAAAPYLPAGLSWCEGSVVRCGVRNLNSYQKRRLGMEHPFSPVWDR